MEEMTTGLCPKCGHTLQIPAELERFSCMYCGERQYGGFHRIKNNRKEKENGIGCTRGKR